MCIFKKVMNKGKGFCAKAKDMCKLNRKAGVNRDASYMALENRAKRGYRRYTALVICVLMMSMCIPQAFAANAAAGGDPLTVINNLSDFIFSLIRAVGLILLGWGIVQVGLSLQSHDPSQRSNGFLTLAGGVIIMFAKEILNLITG